MRRKDDHALVPQRRTIPRPRFKKNGGPGGFRKRGRPGLWAPAFTTEGFELRMF